jgi:hypothetical protein
MGIQALARKVTRLEVAARSRDAAGLATLAYLISFFADMNYGNPHQYVWSIYLVPGIAWHCVVAFELPDEDPERPPDDPDQLVYCALSFQAFLYRW